MNSEDVQQVVAGCGCGEDRAHSLLKVSSDSSLFYRITVFGYS